MECQAVIFDLFGTVVPSFMTESYHVALREMAAAVGAAGEDFARLWREEDAYRKRGLGFFKSPAESIAYVCRRLGLTPSPEAVVAAAQVRIDMTRRSLRPRADAAETLSAIRRRGVKTALMSNCSADVPLLWPKVSIARHFDEALFSCLVALRKPDLRFYELTRERLSAAPQRCLYVGDGADGELSAARRAGMHPVHICAKGEEEQVMAQDDAQNWTGPRIHALREVLAFLD